MFDECLKNLRARYKEDYQLVVSSSVFAAYYSGESVVWNAFYLDDDGFISGRVIRSSFDRERSRYILLIKRDVQVSTRALENMRSVFEKHNKSVIVRNIESSDLVADARSLISQIYLHLNHALESVDFSTYISLACDCLSDFENKLCDSRIVSNSSVKSCEVLNVDLNLKKSEEAPEREVLSIIDQQNNPVIDSVGVRWYRCEVCGKVASESAFYCVGGKNKMNLGTCRDCFNSGKFFEFLFLD